MCVCVCVCVYSWDNLVYCYKQGELCSGAHFSVADEELGAGLKFDVLCGNAQTRQGSSGELNISWVCAGNLGHPNTHPAAEQSSGE